MADFIRAMAVLKELEFSKPDDCLHKNKTEQGLTYWGIYEKANPDWKAWEYIHKVLSSCNGNLKAASEMLFFEPNITKLVYKFYNKAYWQVMRGDEIASQKIAVEIFIFGVNAGMATAIRVAQSIVGVTADGTIGAKTIAALNTFDGAIFDKAYDELEIVHYNKLMARNPSLRIYANGWRRRAYAI